MSWREVFSSQIRDPVTEIIMIRHDEATHLAVEGMTDKEGGVAAVTVFGEVWGIYAISQEEGILPFLRTNLRPIYS